MGSIAGYCDWTGGPAAAQARRIHAAQEAYGRDREGFWDGGAVALASRLSRVLPEDRHDRQPLAAGGGRFTLVADVRLDNRPELLDLLGLERSWLAGRSDADFLAAAWQRWGGDCVLHLQGDFAMAVWDRDGQELFLARDRMGGRPLHWHAGDGFFAFATMPLGVLAIGAVPRGGDLERMAGYMALYGEYDHRSYFRGVSRVMPGERAWVGRGRPPRFDRYWKPGRRPSLALARPADHVDALRDCLDRAVADRLRSLGPVGSQLSGGLDSTAVTTSAARQLAARGEGLRTFTAVPMEGSAQPGRVDGRFLDEQAYAAATAALYPNITQTCCPTRIRPTRALIEEWYRLFQRPVTNMCYFDMVATMAEHAQGSGTAVMLTGMLGNMTISYGEIRVFSDVIRTLSPRVCIRTASQLIHAGMPLRNLARSALQSFVAKRFRDRVKGALGKVTFDSPSHYSFINPDRIPELGSQPAEAHLDTAAPVLQDMWGLNSLNMLRIDFSTIWKGIQARYGVDMRDPTADARLVDLCGAMPPEAWFHDGRTRGLARALLKGRTPDFVRLETGKGLQYPDWWEWLAPRRGEFLSMLADLETCPDVRHCVDLQRLGQAIHRLGAPIPDAGADAAPRQIAVTRRGDFMLRFALARAVINANFLYRARRV